METKYFVNYSYKTLHEFYAQGIITQAQWEAYEFAWANTHITSFPYRWTGLLQDAREEFWKLFHVLPKNLQKTLHRAVVSG